MGSRAIMASLQDFDPKLKAQLHGSWRLLKAWHANELPTPAAPLTEKMLQAMVGYALFNEWYSFALSLMLGFYGGD